MLESDLPIIVPMDLVRSGYLDESRLVDVGFVLAAPPCTKVSAGWGN